MFIAKYKIIEPLSPCHPEPGYPLGAKDLGSSNYAKLEDRLIAELEILHFVQDDMGRATTLHSPCIIQAEPCKLNYAMLN